VDRVRLENVNSNKVVEAGAGTGDLLGRGLGRELLETFDRGDVLLPLRNREVRPARLLEGS